MKRKMSVYEEVQRAYKGHGIERIKKLRHRKSNGHSNAFYYNIGVLVGALAILLGVALNNILH